MSEQTKYEDDATFPLIIGGIFLSIAAIDIIAHSGPVAAGCVASSIVALVSWYLTRRARLTPAETVEQRVLRTVIKDVFSMSLWTAIGLAAVWGAQTFLRYSPLPPATVQHVEEGVIEWSNRLRQVFSLPIVIAAVGLCIAIAIVFRSDRAFAIVKRVRGVAGPVLVALGALTSWSFVCVAGGAQAHDDRAGEIVAEIRETSQQIVSNRAATVAYRVLDQALRDMPPPERNALFQDAASMQVRGAEFCQRLVSESLQRTTTQCLIKVRSAFDVFVTAPAAQQNASGDDTRVALQVLPEAEQDPLLTRLREAGQFADATAVRDVPLPELRATAEHLAALSSQSICQTACSVLKKNLEDAVKAVAGPGFTSEIAASLLGATYNALLRETDDTRLRSFLRPAFEAPASTGIQLRTARSATRAASSRAAAEILLAHAFVADANNLNQVLERAREYNRTRNSGSDGGFRWSDNRERYEHPPPEHPPPEPPHPRPVAHP